MAQRSLNEIMQEGLRLENEYRALLKKSIVDGALSSEETARKAQLEGYLLGLVEQAQAQGVGVGMNPTQNQADGGSDEDADLDADLLDEDELGLDGDEGYHQNEGGFGYFGGDRY